MPVDGLQGGNRCFSAVEPHPQTQKAGSKYVATPKQPLNKGQFHKPMCKICNSMRTWKLGHHITPAKKNRPSRMLNPDISGQSIPPLPSQNHAESKRFSMQRFDPLTSLGYMGLISAILPEESHFLLQRYSMFFT